MPFLTVTVSSLILLFRFRKRLVSVEMASKAAQAVKFSWTCKYRPNPTFQTKSNVRELQSKILAPLAGTLRKFFWETADFRRYGMSFFLDTKLSCTTHNLILFALGLLYHDTVNDSIDFVQEAIRRLPPHEYDGRQFRIMRAANLGMNNEVLPKDQWTQWHDVISNHNWYLTVSTS